MVKPHITRVWWCLQGGRIKVWSRLAIPHQNQPWRLNVDAFFCRTFRKTFEKAVKAKRNLVNSIGEMPRLEEDDEDDDDDYLEYKPEFMSEQLKTAGSGLTDLSSSRASGQSSESQHWRNVKSVFVWQKQTVQCSWHAEIRGCLIFHTNYVFPMYMEVNAHCTNNVIFIVLCIIGML